MDDADADPANEIQTISSPDNSLTITPVGNNYNIVINAVQGSLVSGPSVIVPNTIGQGDIGNDAVGNGELRADAVGQSEIQTDGVATDEILNGTILNEDINSAAAIAGTKINPNFGSQNILTTANITTNGGNFVSVATNLNVPDYVFQKYFLGRSSLNENYDFPNLQEIEVFVKKNHHLPGIKSAKQVEEDGVWNLSASNLQNLEKIEELFLHTIAQEKKIDQLQNENKALTQELEALKGDIALIKQLLQTQAENE